MNKYDYACAELGHIVNVYLDGVLQSHVTEAHAGKGWVRRYKAITSDAAATAPEILIEQVYGEVVITDIPGKDTV